MDAWTLYLPGILLALGACGLGLMSPGPNVMAVIGTAMSSGRSQGMALAAGVSTGSALWASATAAGLSSLLAAYAGALTIIKIIGGVYLLWLAFKSFRSAASPGDLEGRVQTSGHGLSRLFLRGLTVQMSNPKAALTWIAIMSLGLAPNAPIWVVAVIVIGAASMSLAAHSLYALAFSTGVMVRLYSKARRWIQGALGLFFTYAGIRMLAARL
ncbi:LysE family translocator [Hwanghaeella grinnelliae]|uniref:LysE family translocator n=1 Tax=Hwanghaeella grinnelliae TaxID=2500179 RepID=A0A3S2W6U9_9PROT|nr:LysE family transporter [Hwanghaeella grinnelliae]RVU38696.1 LysE family translocator [Hwanghaeella grinnelliae]